MEGLEVRDVMTNLVVTVRPGDAIAVAAKRLLANRISGAPVVEEGRVVGVVSEADLLKAFARPPGRQATPAAPYPLMFLLLRSTRDPGDAATVADVMTRSVVTIAPDATVWQAAALIDRHGVRRLPVVDGHGYLVGVVARSDLVRCMARSHEELRTAADA